MYMQSVCGFSGQRPTSVTRVSAEHSSAKGGDDESFFFFPN